MDINEKIKEVVDKIIRCNEAYQSGERLISDTEYDSLVEWLRTVDPNNPLVAKVQNDVQQSNRKKFDFGDKPMLSLNKVYSIEDLLKWMKSVSRTADERFLLQPKYDGLSGCISGEMSRIFSTRGDGHFGEIINSKMPMIKIDKWTTDYSGNIESLTGTQIDFFFPDNSQIRGEIIIRKDKFDALKFAIKKKDGEDYKNTRNAVSGLMNPNSSVADDYITSEKLKDAGISISFISHDEISTVVRMDDENLEEKIEKTWNSYLKNLPYDQDGLVIKLADRQYADSLGNTEHHPRGAVALKKNNESVPAEILNIEWFVGAQGELTPVYIIEPTEVDGVVINNVLAHNMKNLQDNDIQIGDTVFVCRAGGVIPFAVKYEKSSSHKNMLFEENNGLKFDRDEKHWLCPCCGFPVIYDPSISPDCYCSNDHCHDRVMKRLYNAVSKCFGVKGLAEETLEKLYTAYQVETVYQLLDLSVEEIAMLPGFADKSAQILYDAIQEIRFCTDVQVLASLGIPLIGMHVAEDVLSNMSLSALREASVASLSSIKGFGPAKAQSLTEGLRKYASELQELLIRVECVPICDSKEIKEIRKQGPTICFTGASPIPRSECQALAALNGYEPVSSVNKQLTILVAADTDTNSTKAQKARKYGTKVIGFQEWFNSLKIKKLAPKNEKPAPCSIDVLDLL